MFPYGFRDKYLSHPADGIPKDDNSRMSGGFPHSETHGSKPIPGSPWLIAGYHVLHRLLLPRHPPNALFALDLIQKEHGMQSLPARTAPSSQKLYIPMPPGWFVRAAVSVLDLEQYRPGGLTPLAPRHSAAPAIPMFLSQRCQSIRSGTGQPKAPADALDGHVPRSPKRRAVWWSLPGSNR